MSSVDHPFSVEKYLDSGLLTDVELNVRSDMFPEVLGRKFRCHKLFLAMRNDVFNSMFYGGLAEEGPVNIVDLHPDGFNIMLRYLYSGKASLKSIEDALHARAAARKYLVPALVEGCTNYIKSWLKASNLCAYLDYYGTTQEPEMDTTAVNTVLSSSQSSTILTSEGFIKAQEYTLDFILGKIRNVQEISVAEALMRWAQEQCVRSLGWEKPLQLKGLMRSFFPKLRFLAMTAEEFINGPASWGIMDAEECLCLLRNIAKNGSQKLPPGFCDIATGR